MYYNRYQSDNQVWYFIVMGLAALVLLIWGGVRAVCAIDFDQNCGGYLKRAADANTVETAHQELGKALKYIEAKHLTQGYTSVLWNTPDEDVGFWYHNLKSAQQELTKVTTTTTQLERSNLLLKLRETLLDKDGITVPDGISVYPMNTFLWWLGVIASLLLFGAGAIWMARHG
ncbi:MAG: hypothetical protein WC505_05965 [Patescibacteria group bacterium]